MMRKKDYILIAGAIRDTLNVCEGPAQQGVLCNLAGRLADKLGKENPDFKRKVFLADSGLWS